MSSVGYIYLLPSETQKVIVKYYPKYLISCVLPETSKEITAYTRDYDTDETFEKKLQIKIPSLILSHTFRRPWMENSKIEAYFSINSIDLKQLGAVSVAPYRLANLYPNVHICFGDIALDKKPDNLRQANNYFWASSFNDDNCPYLDKHLQECDTRAHDHYDELRIQEQLNAAKKIKDKSGVEVTVDKNTKCACCINECGCSCACNKVDLFFTWIENYYTLISTQRHTISTNLFCGEKFFACDKPSQAVFFSVDKDFQKNLPKQLVREDCFKTQVCIGVANLDGEMWNIDLDGKHSVKVKTDEVEII